MKEQLKQALKNAELHLADNKALIKKLKKQNKNELDKVFHLCNDEVFNEINCLDCANCCKTTGPRIINADIGRMSKALKIKPSDFVEKFLRTDEDGDYVFKTMPCPFLEKDNYCSIYENRPVACREYPHTDRKRMYQILDLTLTNSLICPAVATIFEKIKYTR